MSRIANAAPLPCPAEQVVLLSPHDLLNALEVESDPERLRLLGRALGIRVAQLETALETRIVLEQAKGMLAERLGLPVSEAFLLLRRSARSNRMKLHDLAAEVVASPRTPAQIADQVKQLSAA